MIYTLFYSRFAQLDPAQQSDYGDRAASLRAHVEASYPGFVDQKTYTAEDGERLTVVRFRDPESQAAWRRDERHRDAQRKGRETWYDGYRIVICEEVRSRSWSRNGGGAAPGAMPTPEEGPAQEGVEP